MISEFYFDNLIEVYEIPGELRPWVFRLLYDGELKESDVACSYPEEAVSSAKLEALGNFVQRSPKLCWLAAYGSDMVLSESRPTLVLFGDIRDYTITSLFLRKQNRLDFLQRVVHEGTATHPVKMFNLDGGLLDGTLTSRLILRDPDTAVLLEEFELRNVAV